MFVVQGYKPIVFVIGILIILYRQVILHSEKYESQIKNWLPKYGLEIK